MFGFGNDDNKKPEQRKPYWIAPTTGNVYWEPSDIPKMTYYNVNGAMCSDYRLYSESSNGTNRNGDDALDDFAPLHGKQQKEMAESIKKMEKLMVTLIERQNCMEQMIASLLRHQYDQIHQQDKMNEQSNEQQR